MMDKNTSAEILERCLVNVLEDTGSELVPYQKAIIHDYCMKIYYLGFKMGQREGKLADGD